MLAKAVELAQCSPSMTVEAEVRAPMVAVAIYAGLRKGELLGLRWGDVNLDARRLDVRRSYDNLPKSSKVRHVPLNPVLVEVLRAWKRQCPTTPEGVVFPIMGGTGREQARPGIESDDLNLLATLRVAACHRPADGHCWHMLRHTFASHFIMSSGSVVTLQKLLGHSTLTMTMRYAHLAPDFLAAEVARMNFAAPMPATITSIEEARRTKAAAIGNA